MLIFPVWLFMNKKYRVNMDIRIYSKWMACRSLAALFIALLVLIILTWIPLDCDTRAKCTVSGVGIAGLYIIFELIMQVAFYEIKDIEKEKEKIEEEKQK